MEPISYELRAGQLNQTMEKIKNCRVVKPTYDLDGFYSAEFMLDKRFGLESKFSDATKNFLDYVDIQGVRFYFYTETVDDVTKGYLGVLSGAVLTNVTPSGFILSANAPRKVVYGRNIYGTKESSGVVAAPQVGIGESFTVQGMDDYTGGFVKFQYTGTTGIAVGDYLLFTGTTSVLKGGLNRVEYVSGGYVYVIGTNSRGSVPKVGDTFDVFKAADSTTSNCIMVAHEDVNGKGVVSLVTLDGSNQAWVLPVLNTDEKITDMVNFDSNIFVLTGTRMYFSRSTNDDNTQFYPLDNYKIDGWYRLFPIGKALLAFGRQNKLFAAANATNQNVGYVGYDVNYNGNLFSKYSTIFVDQTIYVLQDDQQLMQVDIVQSNATTFDLAVKNILLNTRGVFEDVADGGISISSSSKFLNFLSTENGNTVNYEFDKQYQHWLVNEYVGLTINKFSEDVLLDGHICFVGEGFTDMGTEYAQEINFSIIGGVKAYMPVTLRTIFGLVNSEFDVNLACKFELGGKSEPLDRRFNNFDFDNRLVVTPSGDELIGYDGELYEVSEYDGTTFSLQTTILKTWRYIRFQYNSLKRFCMGDTFILADYTKPFINEINKGT